MTTIVTECIHAHCATPSQSESKPLKDDLVETKCATSRHKSYHIKSQRVLNASYGPGCQLNPTFSKSNHQVKGGVIVTCVWCMDQAGCLWPGTVVSVAAFQSIMEMHNTTWEEVSDQAVSRMHYGLVAGGKVTHQRFEPRRYVNWLDFWWRDEKCDIEKNKKQNADSLFLWFICWFLPRCEYDSMFVQDDVILNVGFFFSTSGIHSGLQHALLLLLATRGRCVWL